jgi:hypothetical protein
MGWAYTDALWGYFHINPVDLGVGVMEYVLSSLNLFSPSIVIVTMLTIVILSIQAWDLDLTKPRTFAQRFIRHVLPKQIGLRATKRASVIASGVIVTAIALLLAWLASHFYVNVYVLLGLLGVGPMILTWPTRANRRGRLPYALAIIVSAVCALWAGSIYASNQGVRAAQQIVRDLPSGTAVAVYSVEPLALSGPGVTRQQLSASFQYHYCYEGLRLLLYRSGSYYILPVGWSRQLNLTYILDDSDDIRIALYPGERPSS